jgi:hypothetical protein
MVFELSVCSLSLLILVTSPCLSREFFYIQIEKYARQYLAEGVRCVDDLVITTDSDLYRVLNLHYNRSNQIEVRLESSRVASTRHAVLYRFR